MGSITYVDFRSRRVVVDPPLAALLNNPPMKIFRKTSKRFPVRNRGAADAKQLRRRLRTAKGGDHVVDTHEPIISTGLNFVNSFVEGLLNPGGVHNNGCMPDVLHGRENKDIGARIEMSRVLLGAGARIKKGTFAEAAKINATTYSMWIQGKSRPSVDNALALTDVYPLTLDWIFKGSLTGLPGDFQRDVLEHVAKQAAGPVARRA